MIDYIKVYIILIFVTNYYLFLFLEKTKINGKN